MTTRIARIFLALLVGAALFAGVYARRYPADTTPEGAYLRLAKHLELGEPERAFSYLEVDARDAAYSLAQSRTVALAKVRASFPRDDAAAFAASHAELATGDDGPRAFVRFAEARGWIRKLSEDVSPIDHLEVAGDRATVVTRKGTRYPFRRDRDGRYGLTSCTAELVAEAKRAARDLEVVLRSAADYDRRRAAEGGR